MSKNSLPRSYLRIGVWLGTYFPLEFMYLMLTVPRVYTPMFSKITQQTVTYQYAYMAVIAYACVLTAWYVLVLRPITQVPHPKVHESVGKAVLLALAVYGVYNVTNMVTLPGWDAGVSVLDTLWGVAIFATTTLVAHITWNRA